MFSTLNIGGGNGNNVLCRAVSSVMSDSALLSFGFPKLEYWNGLPCPPPGDLGDSGTEPVSPVSYASLTGSLWLSHQGSPNGNKT